MHVDPSLRDSRARPSARRGRRRTLAVEQLEGRQLLSVAPVADIRLEGVGSYPRNLTDVGGTLYFRADDGTSGEELWKSDGTTAGTVRVADIRPGSFSSYPGNLTNVGGTLYFSASDATSGNDRS